MARGKTTRVEGCPGLYTRQRASDMVYELKLGGITQTLLGVKTLKEATAVWKERTLKADQSGDAALPTPTKFAVVWADFLDRWDEMVAAGTRKASTKRTYLSAYSQHVGPWFSEMVMHRIGAEDIVDYISDRREDGASEWLINGEITLIRNVCKRARRRKPKAMFADPFADIEEGELPWQQPREDGVRKVLRQDELEKLFSALAEDPDLAELAITIAFCGFRRNEALGLRWNCIDLVDGVVHLDKQLNPPKRGSAPSLTSLKNKRPRDVMLLPRVQEALERKLEIETKRGFGNLDDFVFTDFARPGIPVDPSRLTKQLKAAAVRAKIHGTIGPQVLRRSAATIWASAGVQREVGAQMLGHAPEVWDANYVTPFRDAAEREAAKERLLRIGFGALLG